ncbi:PP2C family serine/threonine-protein phosphatase [Streptomyces sp. NPDC018972]|uniref:PP2C family serine/threonine-protein phosphatase n=1 Tax=Streptomyces sp. NPDC018972 TaxID=3365060 RepID=UPI0037918336
MSQMPQQAALSKCPSCEEPLESGDRFCGACGYDLSAVPARPRDEPTIAMNGAVPSQAPAERGRPRPPSAPPAAPAWPAPDGPAAPPAHRPADPPGTPLPGTSAGHGAPAQGAPVPPPPVPGAQMPPSTAPDTPVPPPPGQGTPVAPPPGQGTPVAPPPGQGTPVAPPPAPDAQVPPSTVPGTPVPPSAQGAPVSPSPAQGTPVPPSRVEGTPASPASTGAVPPPPPAEPPVPSSGVRFDRRAQAEERAAAGRSAAQPDEYPLQAPDPRVAAEQGAAAEQAPAAGGAAVCVACRAGRVDDDGYCENCGHAQPRERDHMEQEHGPVAAVSDRGLRHHRNEDAFAVSTTALPDGSPASVAIVCDGVSSATRPDEASLAASRAANESLLAALPRGTHPQTAMHDAIVAAADAVNALADEPAGAREHAPHQNAPACTIVGAVVTAGLLVVGWVGDSRAYWVPVDRSAPAARLTEDDSWAAQMVAAGLMGEAEAYADQRAHAITGWLGADAYELEPHTASFKPDRPGVVVVCTDGLWNYAESADEMAGAVPADAAVRPLHAARVLVGHALDGGGHDNVTVALVPFPAVPQGAGSA